MTFSKSKDYRLLEEVVLSKEDITDIALKRHFMQQLYVDTHKDLTIDDCMGLPLPYLLGFDEVFLHYKKGEGKFKKGFATAYQKVNQNDPWFYCHFLGDPVMPGSQGQDILFQLAAIWATARGEMIGRPRALAGTFDFTGQILPTSDRVFYRIEVKKMLKKQGMLFFEGTVAVDQEENIIYRFTDCRMGFFSKENLGISQRAFDYYHPEWHKIKERINQYIDESRKFYERERT